MAHGFLRRIFEVFDRFETPVDMVATSEVSVSLTIDRFERLDAIQCRIAPVRGCRDRRRIRPSSAWWATISATLRAWRAAFSTRSNGINIRMISQGASLLNLSFVIAEADLLAHRRRACTANFSPSSTPRSSSEMRPCMPDYIASPLCGYGKMGRLVEQLRAGIRLHGGAEARLNSTTPISKASRGEFPAASMWRSIFPSPPRSPRNVAKASPRWA